MVHKLNPHNLCVMWIWRHISNQNAEQCTRCAFNTEKERAFCDDKTAAVMLLKFHCGKVISSVIPFCNLFWIECYFNYYRSAVRYMLTDKPTRWFSVVRMKLQSISKKIKINLKRCRVDCVMNNIFAQIMNFNKLPFFYFCPHELNTNHIISFHYTCCL